MILIVLIIILNYVMPYLFRPCSGYQLLRKKLSQTDWQKRPQLYIININLSVLGWPGLSGCSHLGSCMHLVRWRQGLEASQTLSHAHVWWVTAVRWDSICRWHCLHVLSRQLGLPHKMAATHQQ